MEYPTATLEGQPQEIILQLFEYLPYVSKAYLARTNKALNRKLCAEVRECHANLRAAWRVVNLTKHFHTQNRRHVVDVVDSLVYGEIFGNFIEKLICNDSAQGGQRNSESLPWDSLAFEAAIKERTVLARGVSVGKCLEKLEKGDGQTLFLLALTYMTNLRQIDIPCNFDCRDTVYQAIAMWNSFASNGSIRMDTSALQRAASLHKVAYINIGAANAEDGAELHDLYLLLPLPRLRVLNAFRSHSDDNGRPIEYPNPEAPISRIKHMYLENCAITRTDMGRISTALGAPCTIYHDCGINQSHLCDDDSVMWSRCYVDGEMDLGSAIFKTSERKLTFEVDIECVLDDNKYYEWWSEDTTETPDTNAANTKAFYEICKPYWELYGDGYGS